MAARMKWGAGAGGAILLAVGGILLLSGSPESAAPSTVVEAKAGDLKIAVVAEGQLKPKEFVRIKAEIETVETLTVKTVVPNGAEVKKGQTLIVLDRTELESQISRLKIDVQAAESELVFSREEVSKAEMDKELNVRSKTFSLALAEKELEKYRDLDGPRLLKESEMKLHRAAAELEDARKNHAEAVEMHKQDLVAESEVKKAELRLREAENALESARMGDELLRRYTHPIELQRLEQHLEDARKNFESIGPYMEALVSQKKAGLSKAERALGEQKEQLTKKEKDLASCEIASPADGMVNYGSPEGSRWRGYDEDSRLKVGSKVSPHNTLLYIPDLSKMRIEILVDEMDISKVQKGQTMTARTESHPDVVLHGKVEEVSQVASQDAWWEQSTKFRVECSVEESHDWFRPDLKAKVEILVEELKGVCHVPLEAVFEKDGAKVCHLDNGTVRAVTTGKSTNDFIEIREGLAPGERVLLSAPAKK